ncbi:MULTISPECIES: hypothetical protein [Niastella]|uniref:Uncharacterized protein n=1 Tax=Niastella soli TaxID=2821487 RepID=A0ABS3YVF2_9BACT|nr:hypothetical protein [Niastella soli]MBO9201146.1 hypothetical protein [Niastella soli]
MKLNSDCMRYTGDKKDCPVSERGKTFRLINTCQYPVSVFQVDSCLIKGNKEKKCDFLFVVDKKLECKAYFVELKGTDLTGAIHQVLNSIDILYKSLHEHKIYARIVGKRVTPNIKSKRVKLDEKVKQFGGDLKIVSAPELLETI